MKGSGQEGPVPFRGELLPEVSIPARRVIHPRREGLKEVIEALVLPFVPPAEVVVVQFADEGDQLDAAVDLAVGSKRHGVKVPRACERCPTLDGQKEHQTGSAERSLQLRRAVSGLAAWLAGTLPERELDQRDLGPRGGFPR